MKINIDGLDINYEIFGEGNNQEIILLHGWGASIKAFEPVYKKLKSKYKVFAIDMPGFGLSSEPPKDFFVSDYAKVIFKIIQMLNITNPTLVGHSFGGRVIMKLVGELGYIPKNIILIDSAGIKPKRNVSYYLKVYSYKFTKKMLKIFFSKEKADVIIADMRKKRGSSDYNSASDTMKSVFVNVVNEDLKYTLKNIKVPTLLIWGENDKDTPLKDAKIIEKNIEDCGLVILKDAGHYSYLDKLYEFLIIVDNFLKGSDKE